MAKQQWHRYEDRKPTEADANTLGYVMWAWTDNDGKVRQALFEWDDEAWLYTDNVQWMRIPDPLPPKRATQ